MNWQTRYAECKERVTMNKYTGYSFVELVNLSEKLLRAGDELSAEIDKAIAQRHVMLNDVDEILTEIKARVEREKV